jgi:hypothetical protein
MIGRTRWILAALALGTMLVAAQARAQEPRHALSATGERFEVVVKNDPIAPGATAPLDVFVSDFETNAPVAGAEIALTARDAGAEVWSGVAAAVDAARPGVYRASFQAPGRTVELNLLVTVRAAGVEEKFALEGLEVGAHGGEHGDAPGGNRRPSALWLSFAALFVSLAVVLATALRRRRGAGGRAAMVALALPWAIAAGAAFAPPAHAHEGHGDAPSLVGGAVAAGGSVYLAKESQFLLGVRTERVRRELLHRQLAVIGHAAPRGGVEVELTAPQAGRLSFPGGRTPIVGRSYRRGQEIARLAVVDELSLRAPQAGIVTGVFAVHGQLVQPGQKIVSLLDPSVVWVHADVFESDLERVRHATRAVIGSPALPGTSLPGKLVAIGATQGEVPGAVETWFEVPNPEGRLKIGALVDVGIEEPVADSSLVIARSAVFERDGKKLVFVHIAPERFQAREVVLLEGFGPSVAVRSGLAPGERVVTAGGYQLLSSPPVAPSAPAAAAGH